MLDKVTSVKTLKRLFSRFFVVEMNTLFLTLKTQSRMSIFRRLKEIGYYSSYTHAGRYYTIADIPQFDDHGLWFYEGIGFSKLSTLKATIVGLVNVAPAGFTHIELNNLLRLRVHNTLLVLVREYFIARKRIGSTYLYLNIAQEQADKQILRRQEQLSKVPKEVTEPPMTTIIEVLIETIHAGKAYIDPSIIADRLSARAVFITAKQVEHVFTRYGVNCEKKTTESPSII